MKSFKTKPDFCNVLKNLSVDQFTVDDLTKAYLNSSDTIHHSKKAARQFVYRNMQRMMDSGDLVRLSVTHGWPQYTLTEQFHSRNSLLKIKNETQSPAIEKPNSSHQLKERLNQYKLDMLTAMGEAEEYSAICLSLPELKDDVQPLYNESRDRCSKLLGRVKALESLLSMDSR
jgi:hypothetical protein